MEKLVYEFNGGRIQKLNYLLSLPEDYSEDKKFPLIVFLHGAGERGDNHERIKFHGVPKYVSLGKKIPAITLCPQCPDGNVWNQIVFEVKELIDYIVREYSVDEDRISLTGISMGGFGTWEMGMSYPGFFSALAPICGGGICWRAHLIGKTPVWAFHGYEDACVPVRNSIEMCDKLRAHGGNVELTVLQYCQHNSWEWAYERTNLIEWLTEQKRITPEKK
ncbi:MAG: phospholipase [Clostridia bacterium]|nr:phospholipase [Clostridia bacterium]